MQRKRMLIAVLAMILLVGVVSAAVLTYYGRITGKVTVGQTVLLDGLSIADGSADIIETLSGCGKILGNMHNLTTCSDIKKPVVVLNVSKVICPGGCAGGEVDVYPEYRLDARWYDDALFVVLNDSIKWRDFANLSFGYFMEQGYSLRWIPQCNIALRDSAGDVKYFASWHSFRTGINGTVGMQTRITYEKDDFFIFGTDWSLKGFWRDLKKDPWWWDELKDLQFKYFVMQAGDTSVDPNDDARKQVVWLYKFDFPGREIKGIAIPKGYDPAVDEVEFRMVYDFAYNAYPGEYTIITDVVPLGWMDP